MMKSEFEQMSDKKIILFVDDDVDLLENTAFMIKEMGHEVFVAKNGDEAILRYDELKPDLTFMDIRMPKMDGYDAFFKIKQRDPNAKVILITAYNQDEEKHLKAKNMSLLDTINKPYSYESIEQAISKYA